MKELDGRRASAGERGYDSHWAQIRKAHLAAYPLCVMCQAERVTRAAELVHHCDHNPHNNLESNLVSLCNDCHEKIHKSGRFGRG